MAQNILTGSPEIMKRYLPALLALLAPVAVASSQPQAAPSPIPIQIGARTFTQISPTAAYMRSPYRAMPQNEVLLDSLGLKLVLAFDYAKERTVRQRGSCVDCRG